MKNSYYFPTRFVPRKEWLEMADFNNENQNGVFGGFAFGENSNTTESASFFGETTPLDNNQKNTNVNVSANSIFGSYDVGQTANPSNAGEAFKPIDRQKAVTKQGLWTKIRAFLFQEIDLTAPIKVELTPYQQKVENEINDFLHQEVSFKGIAKLFGAK